MTLATFNQTAPLNERKKLKELKLSISAFRRALSNLEWAQSADDSSTHYIDMTRSANNHMDKIRKETREVLNVSSFDLQELINQFKFK